MDDIITIGAVTIPISTAYKATVVGLLSAILAMLGYIIYWLST